MIKSDWVLLKSLHKKDIECAYMIKKKQKQTKKQKKQNKVNEFRGLYVLKR